MIKTHVPKIAAILKLDVSMLQFHAMTATNVPLILAPDNKDVKILLLTVMIMMFVPMTAVINPEDVSTTEDLFLLETNVTL